MRRVQCHLHRLENAGLARRYADPVDGRIKLDLRTLVGVLEKIDP